MFDFEPPAVIASLAHEFRYPNPAMAGDFLYIETKDVEKRESSSQPDERGTVHQETVLKNQDGTAVLEMNSTILVAKRPWRSTRMSASLIGH